MLIRGMVAFAGLSIAAVACAQEAAVHADSATTQAPLTSEARLDRDPNKWVFDIEPAAWFVGASGRVVLPLETTTGNSSKQRLVDLNMDNPRFEPLVEVNARRGDWRGTLRAAYFGAERDATGAVMVTTLLIPNVAPGQYFDLQSEDYRGAYFVKGVESKGSTFGNDWYHVCECWPA